MRTFRVVAVLQAAEFTNCFSVHGALRRPQKGEKYRSLNAAIRCAQEWEEGGWYAYVVRRTAQGWVRADR